MAGLNAAWIEEGNSRFGVASLMHCQNKFLKERRRPKCTAKICVGENYGLLIVHSTTSENIGGDNDRTEILVGGSHIHPSICLSSQQSSVLNNYMRLALAQKATRYRLFSLALVGQGKKATFEAMWNSRGQADI